MREKSVQRCMNIVGPALEPGERVELVELLGIGKPSKKKQAAVAAAAGIATGGMLMVAVRPRMYAVVFTDRRLFLIDCPGQSIGKSITAWYWRKAVRVDAPLRKRLLTYGLDVDLDGRPVYFSWGRAVGRARVEYVAAALGAPAA